MIRCSHAPSGVCFEMSPNVFRATSSTLSEAVNAPHKPWATAQPFGPIFWRISLAKRGSSSADR
eukprot:7094257-Lingulodinium_polyedra.AAC.1